jgi:hypothetical protein
MTDVVIHRPADLRPALMAAAALHVAVFAFITLTVKPSAMPAMGAAVPINIVASGPVTDSRPAEAAPLAQDAMAQIPDPTAKPPQPDVAPPRADPAQRAPAQTTDLPDRAQTRAAPATRAPAAKPTFSLDALKASIARESHLAPRRAAAGLQGPTRAETAPQARVDAGQGVSQSDLQGLQGLLERLWNTNCRVEGGDAVIVPVRFVVDPQGMVAGRVSGGGEEASPNPVVFAAARRAIDAVHEAEPFAAPYRGKGFTVIFDAKKACSRG